MDSKDRLIALCEDSLIGLGIESKTYKDRLKWELIEAEVQDCYDYFLSIYDKGWKLPNEHNLLIPYLLGICDDVNIDQEPDCTIGEFPDIDIDYLEDIREHIKNNWAPQTFGRERVANIGTYGTYHVNMALIDMARIFGKDRQEVLNVTTNLDTLDDDGKQLSFEKALELYPEFKEYCEKYPEVADAARRLCGRNRNISTHAGGLIISGVDLTEIVPLMGKDYELMTAYTEGQANSDLAALGLVKFDLLGIKTLQHITDCLQLIKQRHGLDTICALPGQQSWSDLSYLNDPKCLEMADRGDLKMIFQFGKDGIRKLVKTGGVKSFDDLSAYAAMYRPGPLQGKVHEMFCRRKRGEEEYVIDPQLSFLEKNYGLMIYQEDVMRILNKVGKIPLRDCVGLIKAISKKKLDKFEKYKDMFIENGQGVLGKSEEEVADLWSKIEFFAGYGFNAAHTVSYTYISARQLYLKSYYPLEFYASGLNHIGGGERDEKLREFKREVECHGIRLRRPELNKSKVEFAIVDKDIYFGFSEIKGMGIDVSKRIVEGQPYNSFEDFLQRFGTDAKVLQPLIALRVFDDADPVVLYKFYEAWRDRVKKTADIEVRYANAMLKYDQQLKELVGDLHSRVDFNDDFSLDMLADFVDGATHKAVRRLAGNYRRSNTKYKENKEKFETQPLSLSTFDPSVHYIDDPEVEALLTDIQKAEQKFFGFAWTHPLEKCNEARGFTFERFRLESMTVGPVEVLITKVQEKQGKVKFYVLNTEDLNWEGAQVTVWEDDFKRFPDELKAGNLVRMRLKAPDPGFHRYTLDGPPKWKRHLLPPKAQDARVVLFADPELSLINSTISQG
jgi:hypothetical protein